MAGDWIKVEHITPDKPEVIGIAERLSIDPDAAFGKLIRLWIWADQQIGHCNDSVTLLYAANVPLSFIDRLTGVSNFAKAMQEVGWLRSKNGKITFPNFGAHNGKTAKTRANTLNRVKRNRNARNVTKPLPEEEEETEYTNEREIDRTSDSKISEEVKRLAKSVWAIVPRVNGDDRIIKQAAICVEVGIISEAILFSAASATAAAPRRNTMAYFTKALRKQCERAEIDFADILLTKVPGEANGKPEQN